MTHGLVSVHTITRVKLYRNWANSIEWFWRCREIKCSKFRFLTSFVNFSKNITDKKIAHEYYCRLLQCPAILPMCHFALSIIFSETFSNENDFFGCPFSYKYLRKNISGWVIKFDNVLHVHSQHRLLWEDIKLSYGSPLFIWLDQLWNVFCKKESQIQDALSSIYALGI